MVEFNQTDSKRLKEMLGEAATVEQTYTYLEKQGQIPSTGNNTGVTGFSKTEGNLHVQVVRGRLRVGADETSGPFLTNESDEDFQKKEDAAMGAPDGDFPNRYELYSSDMVPEDWGKDEFLIEITAIVKRLTKDGTPINPQVDFPQEA